MRLEALLYFYGRRLRTHPIQEVLAGLGIAIGVALAFAVMVANGSIADSATETVRGVTGTADLQLSSRDPRGFDEGLLREVRALPGVKLAAPLLDQRAVLVSREGRTVAVNLASIDQSLAALSGTLPANFVSGGMRLVQGIVVPRDTAKALGLEDGAQHSAVQPLPRISVHVRGRAFPLTVAGILGPETIGSLAAARIALLPLQRLQELAGLPGRLTRILVDVEPGREASVRSALTTLAAGRLSITAADNETRLLRNALGPSDQVAGFFAAISAYLGFLFAFNAVLLTTPERRRVLAELRIQGFKSRQLVLLSLFESAVLGIVASSVGVLIGAILASRVFDATPDYLAPPFTLSTHTIIGLTPVLVSFFGGVLASGLAAGPPLLDLRRSRAVDAVFHGSSAPGNTLREATRRLLFFVAVGLLVLTFALLVWLPFFALVASALLALATVLMVPSVLAIVLRMGEALANRTQRFNMLTMALLAMRATTLRSLALAATGAVALYGCVAIGGARDDLLRGIGQYTSDYVGTADLWVVNSNDNQATSDIRAQGLTRRIAALPGVAAVRTYQGSFLDIPGRRLWVIARPPSDRAMLPASQLVDGDLETATARVRRGGWLTVSQQIADDRGLSVGDAMVLPTPTGEFRLRVAATTTNLGWSPGAVILNTSDYRRGWRTATASALEIDVADGSNAVTVQAAIMQALGRHSGLIVQTAQERADGINAAARQGLNRLSQISLLLLLAAVFAMAAAMGAAIWQRRTSLAALRIQSFTPRQLWRVVLMEACIILGAGCLTGAVSGLAGQVGADRYLSFATGFPVAIELANWRMAQTFGIVLAAALAVVAVPGWFASRVPPHLGLQE